MVGLEFPARFESSQDTLSRRNYRTLKRQSSQKPLKPKKAIKITSRPFKQKQEDRSSGPCSVIDQVFEQEGIERDLFLELRQEVNLKKEDELRLQLLEIGKEIDEPTIQEGFSYQDFELIELIYSKVGKQQKQTKFMKQMLWFIRHYSMQSPKKKKELPGWNRYTQSNVPQSHMLRQMEHIKSHFNFAPKNQYTQPVSPKAKKLVQAPYLSPTQASKLKMNRR